MKLSEVARYWAARELTQIERNGERLVLRAPFACDNFTLRFATNANGQPRFQNGADVVALKEVLKPLDLQSGTWCREGQNMTVCVSLPQGDSQLVVG
jgi:hypothetical protein